MGLGGDRAAFICLTVVLRYDGSRVGQGLLSQDDLCAHLMSCPTSFLTSLDHRHLRRIQQGC